MTNIKPMEFNVVVLIDKPQEKSAGGVFLLPATQDRDKLAAEEGELVAVAPMAFTYGDWPEGSSPPKVGDRVLIARYSGVLRVQDGRDYRICNDKQIVAVIEQPASLAAAA